MTEPTIGGPVIMGRPTIIETKEQAGMVEQVRLRKRYYHNADRTALVEEGDPEAAFLYGNEGTLVPKSEAEDLGADYGDANEDLVGPQRFVVVDEPHHAPGQPVVEGVGRSTKPVEPGRVTEASSTMRSQDEPSKAVTAQEAAVEKEEQRKAAARAENKQRQRAADKSAAAPQGTENK